MRIIIFLKKGKRGQKNILIVGLPKMCLATWHVIDAHEIEDKQSTLSILQKLSF